MANLSAIIAPTNVETASNTSTLSNKTISGASNTLSNIPLATAVTGTLPVANGGTGQTSYTNGQLLIGNTTGNTLTKATLTAGTNVTITNTAGAITIAASGAGASAATPTALGTVYGKTDSVSPYQAFLGYEAGNSITTGTNNTALGLNAAKSTNSGTDLVAVGFQSLFYNTSGSQNVAAGRRSLFNNLTASNNVAVGNEAFYTNTASGNSTAVGTSAGYSTTGAGNQFFGYSSGSAVSSGAKNTIIGSYTGSAAPISGTGSNFVVLSDGDGNIVASSKTAQTFALAGGTLSSGTGIAFPATQSASTDANTLDDYEEGTWTPALVAGTSGTITIGAGAIGRYTKIGRQVTIAALPAVTSVSSPVGTLTLTGFPFANGSATRVPAIVMIQNGATTTTASKGFVAESVSQAAIFTRFASGVFISNAADLVANTDVYFECTYFV